MTPVSLRQATFDDHAAISALEAGQGLHPKSFTDWRRLWMDNPCYQHLGQDWPIGWVLENGAGRVIGSLGNIPLPYVLDGQPMLIAAGRAWVVEERYRGYALLLMDQYFRQTRPDIFLNTTVNAKAAEAFSAFGSLRVPVGDWGRAAYFISAHRRFAESALRIKGTAHAHLLSYPVGLALAGKDRLVTRRPASIAGVQIEVSDAFDDRFDTFWPALCRRSKALLAVRSREVLEWHFAPSIDRKQLWVITAAQDEILKAYAVFQRRDEPRFGLERMRMVDFQSLADNTDYCGAIIRRAIEECREQSIAVLEHVGCGLASTKAFDQYAPYRRQLPAWPYFYRARTGMLGRRLASPDAWAPSSFDGDSSL